jgi:23S rRNA pseudouridine2604 synthase
MEDKIKYPVRINKYLALKNICSRREADRFIKEGKIAINGRQAVLGDRVKEEDLVEVVKNLNKKYIYLAFNKPRRIITHSPQGEETSIEEIINYPEKVFPVGRLDKDSRGLIVLTNDGRITDKLLNPDYNHEKEYIVKVHKPITGTFVKKMGAGVVLDDGYKTRPCGVKSVGDYLFSIILTEGKKRQIRRMCQVLGYETVDLKRVRILNIQLGNLNSGQFREISGKELENFLVQLGM